MQNINSDTYSLDDEWQSCNPRKPRVALLGRPNVGKSTLFNRLTRTREALVDPTPGLTRDVKTKEAIILDTPVMLSDTGGIEEISEGGEEHLSTLVSKASLRAAASADLVLILLDIKEGLTAQDLALIDIIRPLGKNVIFVANKADSPKDEQLVGELYETGAQEIITVSAEHGRNIQRLKEAILEHISDVNPAPYHHIEVEPPAKDPAKDIIKVALIGRPNVGKSSLFNAMTGEERVVVSDVPGTTRDVIDTLLQRPGANPVLLADTAGIRRRSKTRRRVEKFSVLKALEAIKRSHVCLVVLDASEGITDQDKKLIGYTEEHFKACITIYNKWDLLKDPHARKLREEELKIAKRFVPYSPHINCSAKTGRRLNAILPLIDEVFEHYSKKIATGPLNRILQDAILKRTPPISKGHHIRMYYTTQVDSRPPTFLIFTNYPDKVPAQYKRFLTNHFRTAFNATYSPIKLIFRQRERSKKWSPLP